MPKTKLRWEAHATRMSQHALANAGPRAAVARVIGRDRSTLSHECTSRAHPVLFGFFELFYALMEGAETTARALVEAVNEAFDLHTLAGAETSTILERGLYLLDHENSLHAAEEIAALRGTVEHAPACRRHGHALIELAQIEDELLQRRIDLHEVYRMRRVS